MQLAGELLVLVQVDLRRWIESGEALVEGVDVLLRHLNHSLYILQLELLVVERLFVVGPVDLHARRTFFLGVVWSFFTHKFAIFARGKVRNSALLARRAHWPGFYHNFQRAICLN